MPRIPDAFVRSITLQREKVPDFEHYPFSIPAIRQLDSLEINPRVTFFVGENGSGKSTLIEAIAIALRLNAEGGSQNLNFTTRSSESSLHGHLRLARGSRRPATGFFLRAESFFNVSTRLDEMQREDPLSLASYGGRSLHEQSHGEAFLALVRNRFGPDGIYVLDEPEAALSPQRQIWLLAAMRELVAESCQFIVATHSPILMAYPGATIFQFSEQGIAPIAYEETEHFAVTRDFLLHRERYLRELFE